MVGERVIAPAQVLEWVRQGCARLANAAGEALLGVDLVSRPDGGWEMLGASPLPDLSRGGETLVEALAI
jgi:hypothetical protein